MESEKTKEELLKEIERLQIELTHLETSMTQQSRAREETEIFCSVVAQTEDLVVITDPHGIIEYVNPSFERTSGYSKEEALGKTPRIVKSGKQGLKFYKALWKTISSGQVFLGVFVNRRKDGSFYYEQKTITPLKDAQGRITHYLSTGKDITARTRAEEERARLITILEATTDLVMITDLDGKIRYINRAGQTTLGLGEKNPSKISLQSLVPEWARTLVLGVGIPTAIRDGIWNGESAFVDRQDREIPVSQVILAHRTPTAEVEYLSIVARDISDRKAHTAALEYQATHDPLTGLPNRTLFFDRLNHTLLAAKREKELFALLSIDLNRFKEINDTLGHHFGDLLLQQVGSRLSGTLRLSDTVARIGGDEFALILPGVGIEGGVLTARKIQKALEPPMTLEGHSISIGASIGIVLFPEHGSDIEILMRRADMAMYAAKQSGSEYMVYDIEAEHRDAA